MPKTLLAVDDSATMRRVLEITFSGEDYRIVTADSAQAAIAKLSEDPKIVVIDTLLGSDDGYALSKEIRKRDPQAAIVLLASRHNPYDAAKGKDAGADDFMDKPFDTQQLVDKVKKAVQTREAGGGAVAAAPQATNVTHQGVAPPAAAGPATPAPAPAAARPAVNPVNVAKPAAGRANTLMFGGADAMKSQLTVGQPAKGPVTGAAIAQPSPIVARPPGAQPPVAAHSPAAQPAAHAAPPAAAAQPAAKAAPAAAAPAAGVAGKVNGQLSSKLGDLGLTAQQVEAVLALSREVVERVVWEVVPELAEVLIKEEITRLTKA